MAKFRLTQPAFLQFGYRQVGAIVDLNCEKADKKPDGKTPFVELKQKGANGEAVSTFWVGPELPPRSAIPYSGALPGEPKGKPRDLPKSDADANKIAAGNE